MSARNATLQIEARLLSSRAELSARLAAVNADLAHRLAPLSADFAEQATERENEDVLQALLLATQVALREVDAALERLRLGTYGACVHCGEPIEPRRLEGIPYADSCSICAPRRTPKSGHKR